MANDTPEMIRQRAYRARRTAKIERMEAALEAIIAKLEHNVKPLAVEVRGMAKTGLGE